MKITEQGSSNVGLHLMHTLQVVAACKNNREITRSTNAQIRFIIILFVLFFIFILGYEGFYTFSKIFRHNNSLSNL